MYIKNPHRDVLLNTKLLMKSEPADPHELIDHLKNALGLLASERELASHKTISIEAQLKEAAFMVKRVV